MHLGTTLLNGKTMSASSRSGWDIELDAFRDEPPANVLELTSIEVPDGTPAGGNPAALMIHQPSIGVVQRVRVNPPGRAAQRSVVLKSTMRPCSST
ncbi:MAG: hypothetical protein K0R13_3662 [Propionibacteriaceae bacterium]|nr:hypothetical protein [Propionibacteriaceae bacterium]